MRHLGKLISFNQEDFDDGIQNLVIVFERGTIQQRREWPDVRYRGDESGLSLHERLFLSNGFDALRQTNPELAAIILMSVTKYVSGTKLELTRMAFENYTDEEVKVLERNVMYSSWFEVIKLVEQHSISSGGFSDPKEHLMIEGRMGVSIVIYDPVNDLIALMREFRIGALGSQTPWLLGIPGGGIDDTEEVLDAAVREAKEETGIDITNPLLMCQYFVDPGFTSHRGNAVMAHADLSNVSECIGGLDSEQEDTHVEVYPASEVREMLKGSLVNGTAITALATFFLNYYDK